jgi:hypothetical protein
MSASCCFAVGIISLVSLLDVRELITLTQCNRNSNENPVVAQLFWKYPTFNLTQLLITLFKKPILVHTYSRIRMIQSPIPITARSKS